VPTPRSAANDPGEPPAGETADDARLLGAARSGDDAAFAKLVERHDRLLHKLAHHLLDGVDTEAVLEEAYVKAYRAVVGRRQRAARPWLVRTTYLACIDEVRRRERRRRGGPGRKPDRPPETAGNEPLARLRLDQRAVLLLVDGAGLSESEVAQAMASPEPTVAALLAAARAESGDQDAAEHFDQVPAHGDEFWSRLGRRLLAEREAPAAPVPRLPDPAQPTSAARPPRAPPVAMQKRAPRRARFRGTEVPPDTVDDLATDAKRRRTPIRIPVLARQVLAVVAVVAVAGVALVALITMAARARSPVRENSVGDVSRRVVTAMAEVGTFSAHIEDVVAGDGAGGSRTSTYRLDRDRAGSYLLVADDLQRMAAYDESTDTRRARTLVRRPDGTTVALASEETGLAAGPPDASGVDPTLPDAGLGVALRSLESVEDEAAEEDRIGGRPVWVLRGGLSDQIPGGPDRVVLVVDRARLAPVRVTFLSGRRPVRTLAFRDVVLDGPVGPFTFDLSANRVQPVDRGFRRVTLAEVVPAVGYSPLRPAFLPQGFELAAVSVRPEGKVVALRYQRGTEWVAVTTRTSPVARGRVWADPFDRGGAEPGSTPVRITSGPFRLTTAQRVAGVGALPSLWGTDGAIAFTVAGDLTADQLVKVAGSLR